MRRKLSRKWHLWQITHIILDVLCMIVCFCCCKGVSNINIVPSTSIIRLQLSVHLSCFLYYHSTCVSYFFQVKIMFNSYANTEKHTSLSLFETFNMMNKFLNCIIHLCLSVHHKRKFAPDGLRILNVMSHDIIYVNF